MSIYNTNTKISVDLLKNVGDTSEVPDKSKEAVNTSEEPETKGKIFHSWLFTASLTISVIIAEIILFFALTYLIFLYRLSMDSTQETFCSISSSLSALLLVTVELVGALISSYFIDSYTPSVKNGWIISNFKYIKLAILTLAIPSILAIFIVPFLELSTVGSIIKLYSYFLYPIGIGFLYWEIIRIGILTLSFPFIYKKEIRGKKYGLFHFCKTMFIVWVFIGMLAYTILTLWNLYGQYFLNLDLKYFLIPTMHDPNANSTICNRELYYNTTRSNSGI
ncbi:hypothetical protein NEAUS03_1971 [Nematocida ausubeli]|nr:hypothetical protein NEAUS03_1971 [Nematocida ausubeli]